ncbi:MAG TPA: hypothetical protein VHO46_10530, partial [Bacteroidales bacterium]|nr:hypothetical protein [Bacteroidales bacterium]
MGRGLSFRHFKRVGNFILLLCSFSTISGQSDGDYRSNLTGAWNWSVAGNWQKFVSGSWGAAPDYPGQNSGTGTVFILNNTQLSLNVDPAYPINALRFVDATTNQTSLSVTGRILSVTGGVIFGDPGSNGGDQTLTIGTGTVNCGSIIMPETNADNEVTTISVSTGTINCSGSISLLTTSAVRNAITCTGAAIVNIGGDFSGGTFTRNVSTVNYNGGGIQTAGAYTYHNLIFSNSNTKTLSGNSSVTGALTVNNGVRFNLGTTATIFSVTGVSTIIGYFDFGTVSTKTVTFTGSLAGAGTIDMSGDNLLHTLNLSGATNNIGTLTTSAAASTVNYNVNGVQTVFASQNYRNLTISGGNTKTLSGNIVVNNDLTISAGTFDLGSSATSISITGNVTVSGALNFGTMAKTVTISGNLSGGGTINMNGALLAHTLYLGGTNNAITTFNTTAGSGSTVNYNRNGDQQVFRSVNYRNLVISGNGVKTFQNASTVNDNLLISGATLNLGTGAWTFIVSRDVQIDGTLDFGITNAKNLTINGNLSGAGTIDMSTGSLGHSMNLGGISNNIGTLVTTAAASTINYNRATDQSVFASPNYRNLTISGSGIKTLQGDVNVGGNLNIAAGTFNLGTVATSISVSGTSTVTGSLDFGTTTDKNVILNNNFTLAAAGSLKMDGSNSHNLYLKGGNNTYVAGGVFIPGSANQTVYYNGDVNQNVMSLTYNHLSVGNFNSGSTTSRTKTQAGTIIINGNLNIDGYSTSLTTFQLGNSNFTVLGNTNINDYGNLADSGASTNIFTGPVVISQNGRWNVPQPSIFRNGLTGNSTFFTSGSSYTFDTNNQTIAGTQSMTISNIVATGITLTNANTNGLTVTGTISGTGNMVNGTTTNNAILYLSGGANPLALTGTTDFSSNPNTVNFNANIAQTIVSRDFYNLTISGARAATNVTLANSGLIRISGAFAPIATFTTGNYITTGNTIEFNGAGSQNIPALRATNNYNNVVISGGSIKTLVSNVTLAATGTLTLNGGILELDGFNLTVLNIASGAIVPGIAYSSSNMISTGGTGYLEKRGTASGFQIEYPVGSGGYYSPMSISSIGTVTPSYVRVRAVSTAINPSYILKYWDVSASVALNNVNATFQYDPAEANAASSSISFSSNGGVTWQNPPAVGTSSFGANSFTITGTNPFNGWWTMGYRTYYSYQTGNWNDPLTWTSDPSGTLQLGNTVPGVNDLVVVLEGRTVSLSSNVTAATIDLTINEAGYLDMDSYGFTSGLQALRGQGTLQLSSANFPSAVINSFVNAGGGTTEYRANIDLPLTQTIYNNLKINTSGAVVQLNNLILNGNLDVVQGTFQINDNTATRRQLMIHGNVTVASGAFMTVGNGVTNTTTIPTGIASVSGAPFIDYYDSHSHRVVIMGDFTNNGMVRFTNLIQPIYNSFPPTVNDATTGFATVYFQGSTNNTLECNGITDFYNLVLDKGTDQSFSLTINSSDYRNFRLFGANIAGGDGPAPLANPNLKKALWIRTGTLILEGYVVIPSLSEGNDATANCVPNFIIPANGALKLNGADVIVQTTADSYEEVNAAYGVSGGAGEVNGVITRPDQSGLLILGKLEVNNGYLSAKESGGVLYDAPVAGQILIFGGTVDTKQFRPLTAGSPVAYTQTGGTMVLRGRFQRTPFAYTSASDLSTASLNTIRLNDAALKPTAGSFSIENPSAVFTMTGGTINIYDVPAPGATSRAYDILTSSANYNVTGGTVALLPTAGTGGTADATAWLISSSAPLGNMIVNRAGSSSDIQLNTGYPLTVLNDLILQAGVLTTNNQNVSIGGNFSIFEGTIYTPGTNTTIFNGTGTQTFKVDLVGELSLNNIMIDKTAGVCLNMSGSQPILNIAGTFTLNNGTFNDNGNTVNVSGNVYNSGIHTGTGKISLNGTNVQTIGGSGTGEFQNLELNNTNPSAEPVSLIANAVINGTLTFSKDKLFDIKTNNLKLNSSAGIAGAGPNRYIKTTGTLGDGGLTKVYSAVTSFTFPIGAPSSRHAASDYTPSTITLNSTPTSYGTITVNPVGYEHPATKVNGRSLTYYWHVKSSGFNLGTATVTHDYTYSPNDVISGGDVDEAGFVAAHFDNTSLKWGKGTDDDVDEGGNIIGGAGTFLENVEFIDGDFTAGDDNAKDPFIDPTVFYSRANGRWNLNSTWSTDPSQRHTGAAASRYPGFNDIVVIGNNNTVNLVVPDSCASLQIETGSTLDIYTQTNSVFSQVMSHPNGNGLFRLTTTAGSPKNFSFPSNSDFSAFNVNRGTTEYYDIDGAAGALYILPPGVTSYGNLILRALNDDNLVLPNNSATTIYGDLTCTGNTNNSWVTMSWNTYSATYGWSPIYDPTVEKTVTVKGDMFINAGTFLFMDDEAPQHLVIEGDLTVAPGAILTGYDNYPVNNGANPRNNTLAIGGSIIDNSNASSSTAKGSIDLSRTNYVNLTFFGTDPASITNTANSPTLYLNKVTVNKGTNPSTTLTLDIGGTLNTPTDNWLTLQNGTLRYMRTNPAAGAHFNISTTTPFSIPATAGLYIDYANANNVNILIGNAQNNNGDLLLGGKLTIIRGNIFVGPPAGPNDVSNNDIEYTGSGFSEIDLRGGSLVVNGQIRRSGTSGGILKFSQSGNSSVIIKGQQATGTNAKLEILNSGSVFNMSGTSTLTVFRGGASGAFGDLYLRPESSSITGGTILIQPVTGITAAEETFRVDAGIALNNLTITGFAAADAARVSLSVNPLILKGNLTLSNTNSFLNSNNLNVSIGGDLFNSGTYTYGTNTTTFNGNTQSILGATVTNFNNLVVSAVTSLGVSSNFTVKGNLTVNSGILMLANRRLTLLGNILNNGTYTDDNITGEVYLAGSTLQQISGTGSFGRLELNNNQGARLNNDITIQNNLVLTLGKLDIGSNLLTLGLNSSILGAPFSLNNMIVSDGVTSSFGVRKFFNIISAPTNFTFPIGVYGKYTPATYSINANGSVGYINIQPVNNNHPSVVDAGNALNYYWEIESSGITNFDGTLSLKYLPSDVRGTESDYIAARLLVPGTYWSKATTGSSTDNVDESTQLITFPIPSGTNNLSGDYTAGSDPAIPDEVPAYVSISDGEWSDETIWAPVGASPSCPVGGPNGFIVNIDHEVRTAVSSCFAYRTTINNKLIIESGTIGHNLGQVDGNGTLVLESGNLPAGNFNTFLDCSASGTLEYSGTGNYTIIASQYNSVPNLFFTGSGTRTLPNKDLTVCKRLVIDGPTLDNTISNKALIIKGTIERYNTGAFLSGTGAGATVSFQGTSPQDLGGPLGSFNGTNRFNNLEISNSNGLTIGNGSIEVAGNLLLTNGIISTTATDRLLIINTAAGVIPAGGSATSFVNGPLTKTITAGNSFIYPIGTGTTRGHTFTVTNGPMGTAQWTATYTKPNGTSGSYSAPLQSVNTDEFWNLSSSTPRTGYVKMAWDIYSAITPLMTENGITDMRAAEYSGGTWQEQLTTTTGNSNAGDVATTNTVNITTVPKNYTIASITTTIPRASLASTGPICGAAGIPVQFTSFTSIPLDYTLDYTENGTPKTVIINTLPYTLPTPVPGTYQLTGFKYNNDANTGVVDNTPVIAYATPTVSNAGTNQSLCGLTSTTLAGNDPAPFTGLWTIISGSGGTIFDPTLYNSGFIGIAGNTYTLRWTINSGTCKSFDDVIIAFPVAPQRPSNFTAAPSSVCQGVSGYVYTVPNVPGTTYTWNYTGTGATITGSSNSVTLGYNLTSTSGILSVTATNGCGTSAPRSVPVTVNTMPVILTSTTGSNCGAGSVTLGATASAGIVNWFATSTGGTSLGSGDSFVTPVISSTTTYYVDATAGSCTTTTRTAVLATIHNLPSAPTVGTIVHPTCVDPTGSVILENLPAGDWTINPGGYTGNTNSTTISGLAEGTYVYFVTDDIGCTSLASADVVIAAQPTAPSAPAASVTVQPTCAVGTGTIEITSPLGAGYEYSIGGAYQSG